MAVSRRCLDLWSLLAAPHEFEPEELRRSSQDGIAQLMRSRSPRSDPPLRFVHRAARTAVVDAMDSSPLPSSIAVAVVEALIRQPQRYVEMSRTDVGRRRVGMAGVYSDGEGTYLTTAVGELDQVGPATGFTAMKLRAVDVPEGLDEVAAAILAEELESLAIDATNADRDFKWSGGRASRALWCGVPTDAPARQDEVVAVGAVAGLVVTVSDPTRTDRLALGSSPDLLVLLAPFASANDLRLAAEFTARGGEVIAIGNASPTGAITDARVEIHRVSGAQHAAAAGVEIEPALPTLSPPVGVGDTRHASDQGRLRGFSQAEIEEALGDRWTRPLRWSTGRVPAPGKPLVIGIQAPSPGSPDLKEVLLCVTTSGRRLHLVVARTDGQAQAMSVITGWDPEAPENQGIWRKDALRPTAQGQYRLPPTTWVAP